MIPFVLALLAELACCALWNRFDDWTQETLPIKFAVCGFLTGVAFFIAIAKFPRSLSARGQALIFWSVAIVLRVSVIPLEPGDDLWRYQWEGRIQHAGFNPYLTAPDDARLAGERDAFPNWSRINHRDFAAIYPPGTELIFRATSSLSDSPLLYKILFAAADLGSVAVLLRLIGGGERHARAAWYAWNPLVVYSFAGAAHFDSLMILPMIAGVLLLVRHDDAQSAARRWSLALLAALAFGIAISIKVVPAFLLLLCAAALGRYAASLILSLALPFGLANCYGFPSAPIFESLRRFAYVTRLNDLFWWLIEETIWPNLRQKNYSYNVVIAVFVVVISLVFARNWRRGMLWILGAVLILSPVLHPWYCTWILPFAAWRRAAAWQVLSITLFGYFLFWDERLFALPWHSEPWLRTLILAPPLITLASIAWQRRSAPTIPAQ